VKPNNPRTSGLDRKTRGLFVLFALMYLVQGIAEPTEGLIAQPVRSLLRTWGCSAASIGAFVAILELPWSLKPLYGLLTDFVPFAGTRRRSYLILSSIGSTVGLAFLYFLKIPTGAFAALLVLLLIPAVSVAFTDVVVDALMVEKGQPRGLTGKLQSVQWAAMYGGTIIAGFLGGWLSQLGKQREGFLICAATSSVTLFLAWYYIHEDPQPPRQRGLQLALRELATSVRSSAVLSAAAFLLLWSFNPFNTSVLYLF
jgi:hypothetical protein